MKAHRFLLVLALLAVALLPVSNAVAAQPGQISLSANVERLTVRPCLIETVRVGVTNNGARGRFVDVYVTAEGPLRSSKPSFTTWVPAGGSAYANIRISAQHDATPGEYEVRFAAAGSEDLVLPTTLENPSDAPCVPRAGQTATATSFQEAPYGPANAIDGDLATMWHTRWSPAKDPLPQSITVDLGATYDVAELVYEPRKDSSGNGVVTAYTLYGSVDGDTFAKLGDGTWAADRTRKTATVDAPDVRFVRLEVTEGYGGYASAAEIVFYGKPR